MMERKMVLTAVVLLGLLCAAVAQAELFIDTAFDSGFNVGGADTYVTDNPAGKQTSTQNWSTETRMRCRFNGGNSRFHAMYLRFDIGAITQAFAGDTKLQLSTTWLKTNQGSRTLYIYGLVDDGLGYDEGSTDAWVESTITYQNAPGMLMPLTGQNGATIDGYDYGNYLMDGTKFTFIGTVKTPAQVGAYTTAKTFWSNLWGTDSALADFLNQDTNGMATLVLIDQAGTSGTNNEGEFGTKEARIAGVHAPALVPEPATLVLLGLGGLLFARKKR